VDKLNPTYWKEDPMEAIVMSEPVRKAILDLLQSPLFFGSDASTEMLGNKGKGLVVLLHGAPGTGKTFTVESIAEHLGRPLYVLTAGELGSTPEEVNTRLGDALHLSFRWKAITLIEDADIFLEPRSREDMLRNNLVSCNHKSSFNCSFPGPANNSDQSIQPQFGILSGCSFHHHQPPKPSGY